MDAVREIVRDCDPRIAPCRRRRSAWTERYATAILFPAWVSRSHKIALLSDSCHPHLPTIAQGASQATESAAVMALCLKLAGKGNVPLAVSCHPCMDCTLSE